MTTGTRTGRRAGASGTRDAIAAAARRQFAALGYDRTSLRQVGIEAGVDPTLVGHFFGSKQQLFAAVTELPFDPATTIPALLDGPRDEIGIRLARFAVGLLETPAARERVVALVRAAASEDEAARVIRDLLTRAVMLPIAEGLGADQAPYRASLVMSQIVGITVARHIVGIEPLAGREPEALIADLAPVLQRYLTADLAPPSGAAVSG